MAHVAAWHPERLNDLPHPPITIAICIFCIRGEPHRRPRVALQNQPHRCPATAPSAAPPPAGQAAHPHANMRAQQRPSCQLSCSARPLPRAPLATPASQPCRPGVAASSTGHAERMPARCSVAAAPPTTAAAAEPLPPHTEMPPRRRCAAVIPHHRPRPPSRNRHLAVAVPAVVQLKHVQPFAVIRAAISQRAHDPLHLRRSGAGGGAHAGQRGAELFSE
eukprot:scaffold8596_cov128-Isochrysis_galbana.AAC.3